MERRALRRLGRSANDRRRPPGKKERWAGAGGPGRRSRSAARARRRGRARRGSSDEPREELRRRVLKTRKPCARRKEETRVECCSGSAGGCCIRRGGRGGAGREEWGGEGGARTGAVARRPFRARRKKSWETTFAAAVWWRTSREGHRTEIWSVNRPLVYVPHAELAGERGLGDRPRREPSRGGPRWPPSEGTEPGTCPRRPPGDERAAPRARDVHARNARRSIPCVQEYANACSRGTLLQLTHAREECEAGGEKPREGCGEVGGGERRPGGQSKIGRAHV